jgi:hypothetical protein
MKVPYNLTGILSALVVALSVIGLVASPISASVTIAGPDLISGSSQTNPGHHFVENTSQQTTRFQTMITTLSQQGVDVTEPQAALGAGNLTAVSQWFRAYRNGHPVAEGNHTGFQPMNATEQITRFQTMITTLSQQGVDVTEPQAALSAGNLTAVSQWFKTYRPEHPVAEGNHTGFQPMNTAQQTTRLQSVITALGQQGVDVTGLQAALGTGNLTAVSQWFKTYRPEHPGTGMNVSWQKFGSSTRLQQGTALAKHHMGWNRTFRNNSLMTNTAGQAG